MSNCDYFLSVKYKAYVIRSNVRARAMGRLDGEYWGPVRLEWKKLVERDRLPLAIVQPLITEIQNEGFVVTGCSLNNGKLDTADYTQCIDVSWDFDAPKKSWWNFF